jgi:anti-sigma factor RsiW
MNCRSAESLFSALVEDELSQEERRAIEAHLMGCRRCSLSVRELRETMSLLRSLPEAGTSAHFEEDVMARIRSGEALRPSVLEWLRDAFAPVRLRPVMAASAGLCAVAVAVVLIQRGIAPSPVSEKAPLVAASQAPAPAAPAPAAPSRQETLAATPSAQEPIAVAAASRTAAAQAPVTPRRLSHSEIAKLMTPDYVGATADSGRSPGRPLESPYQDEYILDQFLLERAPEHRDPSIVPVGGSANDDVFIEF